MAEVFFVELCGNDSISLRSAGTQLSGPEQTIDSLRPKTDNIIKVMAEIGLDISKKVRSEVTRTMVDTADMVVLAIEDSDPVPNYVTEH